LNRGGLAIRARYGEPVGKALGLNQDLVTKTGVTAGRDEKEAEREVT
jgi:hypothetical protein